MKIEKLVSIIMPTYNREKTLPLAIDTVLSQSYKNWELIIIDDRSTDNTEALVKSYSHKDERIQYYYNQRKKGPGGARNFGIEQSNGFYIAFLDSDDEWFQYHLKDSIDHLELTNYQVSFAGRFDRRSGVLVDKIETEKEAFELAVQTLKPEIKEEMIYFFDQEFYKYNLTEKCHFFHINTMVFKKDVLKITGIFDESLASNEDYDLIFKFFYYFGFIFIKNHHFIYNQGVDNLYAYIDREQIVLENIIDNTELLEKITNNLLFKIKMHKNRLRFMHKTKEFQTNKSYINEVREFIAEKFFSIGFLNEKNIPFKAFIYYMHSLMYKFDKKTLKYLFQLFVSRDVIKKFKKFKPILNID